MKKVLIITYYWPPSGGAGVQRWLKFTKYLPGFGVDPYVLTVDPQYASYPQTDPSLEKDISPSVKVFRTRSFEVLSIISRIFGKSSVPYGGFSNVNKNSLLQTLLRFIRGNFFIPDARKGWNKYAIKKASELIQQYDIKTVITTGPPHSTHLAGLKLKNDLNIRWIADFRDPWTDIYYYSDMLHTSVAKKIDLRKEKTVLDNADIIITNCNSNKNLLLSKTGIKDAGKFHVITNGFDEDDFRVPVKTPDEFTITYTGTISEHYKPRVFFNVLSALVRLYPDVAFRFRLLGSASNLIEKEINDLGLSILFDYRGYVDHASLASFLKSSSALLYIFPETSNDKGVAGKLFEYLAAERPVIAIGSTDSDAAAIIEECEAGRSFERSDSAGLTEYLKYLVEIFKKEDEIKAGNGLHWSYSRKKLTSELAKIIKDQSH